jgi:hypothetical protein
MRPLQLRMEKFNHIVWHRCVWTGHPRMVHDCPQFLPQHRFRSRVFCSGLPGSGVPHSGYGCAMTRRFVVAGPIGDLAQCQEIRMHMFGTPTGSTHRLEPLVASSFTTDILPGRARGPQIFDAIMRAFGSDQALQVAQKACTIQAKLASS